MFELRPYQAPIAERVFTYMKNNRGKHPLVALPTGSGKTVVLADIILKAIERWPETHVLILSHVKEILEQDFYSIEYHTGMDVGLFSAGLNKKQRKQVTVAGIQSVFRRPELFKEFKFIIIDECHLIPPGKNTMYRKFFAGLKNPRYFGLTATPFRLGSGYIYGDDDEAIFDDLIVDYTSKQKFNQLIKDGYLCNLKTVPTGMELDVEGVRTVGGDFDNKGLSVKIDKDSITKMAIKEIIDKGQSYKKWLIFAIDIEHAENIAEELANNGIPTMVVHSKMEFDRSIVLDSYRNGMFRAIVNVNVLTTGFDDPEIDLIALLRPTKSPVIHIQTIGRGLRIANEKDHCLILDFAGNTERLGPINDIVPKKKGKGKGGEPITKRCPACDTIHHPTVKVCPFCGHKFQFKTLLKGTAGEVDVIKDKESVWLTVHDVKYQLYKKKNSPSMVKVTYQCGLRQYHEYVCIEHKGYAGYYALNWCKFRGLESIRTALGVVHNSDMLAKPKRIHVDKSGKYPRVTDYVF